MKNKNSKVICREVDGNNRGEVSMDEKGKLIMNPNLAVFLLRKGFTIIDIKANRTDKRRSVFVFKFEDGLNEALTEYTSLSTEEKQQLNKED